MATREVQMLQQMLDPNQEDPTAPVQGTDSEDFSVAEQVGSESFAEEQELTDEMAQNMPVVNTARDQNRMSGISNFLNNPEVQNALLQFGRAFSGNREGEAGTVLANAGEDMIQSQADQRALEAFERGEDPAQAAGRFANPELVRSLQQQQEQAEQFDQQMSVAEEKVDISRTQLQADTAYKFSKLFQDKKLTERQLKVKEKQAKLDRQLTEARIDLVKARAGALGQGGEGIDPARMSEVTTEYLDTLRRQRTNLQDQLSTIEDVKTEVRDWFSGGLGVNVNTNESWVRRRARELGINVTDEDGNLSMSEIVSRLDEQKGDIQERINTAQEQEDVLRQAQSQRLGSGGGGGTDNQNEEGNNQPEPQGSPDNPVQGDFTMSDLRGMAPGSFATSNLTGETYTIGSDGEPRVYNANNEEEENE